MDWLNSANAIASLVLAIFGIGGYIYGIVTYLKKKASPKPQEATGSTPTAASPAPTSSVKYVSLSWLEWTELFAQGLVDTADFIMGLLQIEDLDNGPVINKLGFCAFICGFAIVIGEFIIGFAIGIFLGFLGMSNPVGAAVAITTILLFMTFSLLYIYHVGLAVEMKQLEKYRKSLRQPQRQK